METIDPGSSGEPIAKLAALRTPPGATEGAGSGFEPNPPRTSADPVTLPALLRASAVTATSPVLDPDCHVADQRPSRSEVSGSARSPLEKVVVTEPLVNASP